jgi:signal transduction histidine kinase
MSRFRSFFKRHTLWIGFLAVFVPLLVLLGLQYVWLVELEENTELAYEATLENYLEAVIDKTESYFGWNAERALNLPAAYFTELPPEKMRQKVGIFFKKKQVEGARSLFVVDLTQEKAPIYFFDPVRGKAFAPSGDEGRAVYVASSPWVVLRHKQEKLDSVALAFDERDPEHRLIMNPITNDQSRLVGLAGMVVDDEVFTGCFLPSLVKEALPKFFSGTKGKNLVVTVTDGTGEVVFSTDEVKDPATRVSRPFRQLHTDWRIGLRGRNLTPEAWVKSNFTINVTLSALLALVLIGGLLLALRAASREMKLSRMKADFVSNVSHELRTPLASIRVFGEFLRLGRASGEEKSREYGEYIETESRRLTQLINNILDFSKIESGLKTYHFEPADLERIVSRTLETFSVRLSHSGFTIRYGGPESRLPPVRIDPDAMGQALCNLLDNAVKYSGEGREIVVSLRARNGSVILSVRDHGIGIEPEEQEKIFERFHRVSTGLVHDVKGSGLGLSIVSHIVKAHGGTIHVESERGRGSTFSIRLPLEPEKGGEAGWEELRERGAEG